MKIAIFGTGGVGGYFGGRLAQHGEDVTFVARGAHLDAIRETGLRVDSINGDFLIQPAKATGSPQTLNTIDLILLAIKGWQLDDAIMQMKSMIGERTMILPLLNGMEHMDKLLDAYGTKHVLGGMCRLSAFIVAPGHIRHVGIQPYIAYGEWDNSKTERLEKLRSMFKPISGITTEVAADIQATMWEKFVFISGTSGMGAYTRQTMGEYRGNPEMRIMLIDALKEATAIARARGVALAENFVDATMQRIDNIDPQITPSMQKDMMAGRPSELNEQTGAVIRMGKAMGVPTPTHEKLLAALLPLEQKARNH